MAAIKTINFLPEVFRSDTNSKFLNATLDQLVAPPDLRKVNAYVGRKFAPTFKSTDNYQPEPSTLRQNYQLEPGIMVEDKNGNYSFIGSYIDLIDQIGHYGGITSNQSRLFSGETYSFDGQFDFDKFVNFNQYYWLPDGPDAVQVYGAGVDQQQTFTVTRNSANGSYEFSGQGVADNPTLRLSYGGIYQFVVNQPGYPFWIQSEIGTSGTKAHQPNFSTRDVLGVTNNGIDVGTITFKVPLATAQDPLVAFPLAAAVDLSTELSYSQIQHQSYKQFLSKHKGIDGIASLANRTLIFVNSDIDDSLWTDAGLYANTELYTTGYDGVSFDFGSVVPESMRRDVWRIKLVPTDDGDQIINLIPDQAVLVNQKVYVKSGVTRTQLYFYLDSATKIYQRLPNITAPLDFLYYQDGTSSEMVGGLHLINPLDTTINVETDILGKPSYQSPNGVVFTNGLKVTFDSSAYPNDVYSGNTYYIEGVGTGIKLLDVNKFVTPEALFSTNGVTELDYLTINRASQDLNPWTRSNRWFHIDVITQTAEYNNTVPLLNQSSRANRPIIEFVADLQLFNYGRIAKAPVDQLDFTITDPRNMVELVRAYDPLVSYSYLDCVMFGGYIYQVNSPSPPIGNLPTDTVYWVKLISITDGERVIFANQYVDPIVRNRIFIINVEAIDGEATVNLVESADYQVLPNNSVIVLGGANAGTQYYYTGAAWVAGQSKISINQAPKFDVLDTSGYSFSNSTRYPATTFTGTKIFSYQPGTGTADAVLGFPLSYRNFNQIGDIQFDNNFDSDTFTYTDSTGVTVSHPINYGTLQQNSDLTAYEVKNVWTTNIEKSKQFQIISKIYNGVNPYLELDIATNIEASVPYFRVYVNNIQLSSNEYELKSSGVRNYVQVTKASLTTGDQIAVLIYSDQVSTSEYFEVPKNLDYNTENKSFSNLTLGQLRNHLDTMASNSNKLTGNTPGNSNLRDVPIKQQGGSIVQHASPVLYSDIFLVDKDVNLMKGLELARHEYSKIKNKILELSTTLAGVDLTNIRSTLDTILKTINSVKNKSFAWYYSDMVPYGDLKNTITYPILSLQIRDYEISKIFPASTLSNQAILVYVNNHLLVKDQDYTIDANRAGVTISDSYDLAIGDILTIYEYSDTDGNYIPETPTKLGLYPKFTPSKYLDNTYQTPIYVIMGHDGSITPAFGDYRDDLLLEFETRIYNNIKVDYSKNVFDVFNFFPGKFRESDYSNSEFTQLLTRSFLQWAGNNRVDFTNNTSFSASNPWTWNYKKFKDTLTGEQLAGGWRAIFNYFYDTDRPHTHPWEMLGFSEMPSWWIDRYGPAPYTGGNLVLWQDLELGYIYAGDRAGYDSRFVRPGLTKVIPVDENGILRSPEQFAVLNFDSSSANASWAVGDQGPVETAWRRSSDFPYAVQEAIALSHPAFYFGTMLNVGKYYKNAALNQYVIADTLQRITPATVEINGTVINNSVVRCASYTNWVAEYLRNLGIDPSSKILNYLNSAVVQLVYKMAGYSDKSLIKVIAEQSSPTSTNQGVVIPNENYNIYLQKSTPTATIVYSGVIVEKSENGYTVSGYDTSNPYFTIIPSLANNNAYSISVLKDTGVIYKDFQSYKVTVPYGYEFNNKQQVVDFLVSYQRYLQAKGFTFTEFDQDLNLQRDFILSAREFLMWGQQGWQAGSILVLSPVLNKLTVVTPQGVIDEIQNYPQSSRVLDANFSFIKNNQFTVTRDNNTFSLTANYGQTIALASLNVVEFEHVMIFDNTTVFNDIIYKPELGNRQYRLKLVGEKTGSWTGNMDPPGFVYNSPTVNEWNPGTDYKKGELVSHKNHYWAAIADLAATESFAPAQWKQIENNEVKTGLLPNFSYNAGKFTRFNDVDNLESQGDLDHYTTGVIGFRERQYMTDFGIDLGTQVKFYQGFIREKGTTNAIDAFTAAGFNGVTSTINLYEEWGMRVGEYGAVDNNKMVEVQLVEGTFAGDPITITLLPAQQTPENKVIGITPDLLYKGNVAGYVPTIFTNRDSSSNYENDIHTAGYVYLGDTDATIFDLANYSDLNSSLEAINVGYKIWSAKDLTNQWNVHRVTETDLNVVEVKYDVDNTGTVTTAKPHGLYYGDIIIVKGFDPRADGFYQIYGVTSSTSFTVIFKQNLAVMKQAGTISSFGPLYKLVSMRINRNLDINTIEPTRGWADNDKLWVDTDINEKWAVYNKSSPWTIFTQPHSEGELYSITSRAANTYVSNSGFGSVTTVRDIDTTYMGPGLHTHRIAAAGMPALGTGRVLLYSDANWPYYIDWMGPLDEVANISYGTTTKFGASLDSSYVIAGNTLPLVYIGNPGDGLTESGKVHVYGHDSSPVRYQTIASHWSSNVGDSYGASISASSNGEWLFIGVPHRGNVEVWHSNVDITSSQTYDYVTTITGSISANFGYTVVTTSDASQTIVSAPYETINGVTAAGASYVYDRSIEKFIAAGQTQFQTEAGFHGAPFRVKVNGNLQTSGFTANSTGITFTSAPTVGSDVVIESNQFRLLEKLVAPTITSGADFGQTAYISGNDADIFVANPGYSEAGYYSGVVYRYVNQGASYGTITGTIANPELVSGDTLRINGRLVTITGNLVANVAAAINSANIVGVTSSVTGDGKIVIVSNVATPYERLLLTTSTNGNLLANLGLNVYTNSQTIRHPGTDNVNQFGSQIVVSDDSKTLVVSSTVGSTYNPMIVDDGVTVFDYGATDFEDPIVGSGIVYVYGLVEGPLTPTFEDQYVLAQRLTNSALSTNDQFGSSLAMSSRTLLIGAPGDSDNYNYNAVTGTFDTVPNSGAYYVYENFSGNVGWDVVRQQPDQVDIASIGRIAIYNSSTQVISTNLDHIDPVKGKLLGAAEQDIDYWTAYDPATYNAAGGIDSDPYDVSYNINGHWGKNQVGKTWWNLDAVRFIDYEQGDLNYRASHWAEQFPGSSIEICEWISSDVPPSQYSGDGIAKFADDSAYVVDSYVDPVTKIIRSKYYYWVKDKTSVTANSPRTTSISTLQNLIASPEAQGIPYAAVLRDDTVSLYGITGLISANTQILHIDYDDLRNTKIIHSEYQLVQEGNGDSLIPDRIVDKIKDSLSGIDQNETAVPDPTLAIQNRIGLGIYPMQSVFIDRTAAVKDWIGYVNSIFLANPIVNEYTITRLYDAEPLPATDTYDHSVDTYAELGYLESQLAADTDHDFVDIDFGPGYTVLVKADESNLGRWAVYIWDGSEWNLSYLQNYFTPFYWEMVDWADSSYDPTVRPDYIVETLPETQTLTATEGQTVKVMNNGNGQYVVYRFNSDGTSDLVLIQNGTIQFKSDLYSNLNAAPTTTFKELRTIFDAIRYDIFVNSLSGNFNEMIFFLLNYILTEQKTVDWFFKSSFVSVVHQLKKLEQFPNYIRDNQTYYEDYINEVKPYRTTIREYLVEYQGTDVFQGNITDFDLPAAYDSTTGTYRSPDGTKSTDSVALSTDPQYANWNKYHSYGIESVELSHPGTLGNIELVSLILTGNVLVSAGATVTQPSTGATGIVHSNSFNDNVITLESITGNFIANVGNVEVGGLGNTYISYNGANLTVAVTANITSYEIAGYTTVPNVFVVGGGGTGAKVEAILDTANAAISGFTVVNPGQGYTSTPEIVINGTGTGAAGYPRLKNRHFIQSVSLQDLKVTDDVTVTAGNIIIQPNSGAYGKTYLSSTGNIITLEQVNGTFIDNQYLFDIGANLNVRVGAPTLYLTANGTSGLSVTVGDIISQEVTGAAGEVYATSTGNVIALWNTQGTFTSNRFLELNGVTIARTPISTVSLPGKSVTSYNTFVNESYNLVRTFNTSLKFDRTTYTSNIIQWAPNLTISANSWVSFDGLGYQATDDVYSTTTLALTGNIYANVGANISQAWTGYAPGGWATLVSNVFYGGNLITVSNIHGEFYQRSANLSVNGVEQAGIRPTVVNNIFDYDKFSLIPADQFTNASDRIMAYYTPTGNMPEKRITRVLRGTEYPGVMVQGVRFDSFTSNVATSNVALWGNVATLYSSNVASLDFTTLGYQVGEPLRIVNLGVSGYAVNTSVVTIASISNQSISLLAGSVINDIPYGANVALYYYDTANPSYLDSSIHSGYTDTALGVRPEDIVVDGGSYYDTYSSYAPQELVPGVTYDSLNMSVYTKINANTDVVAYRIAYALLANSSANTAWTDGNLNYQYWPQYYRINSSTTTELTAALNITDSNIHVADASALFNPAPDQNIPGVIYINGEKIVYYARDAVNNILGQIRRSVDGTGAPTSHPIGASVVDSSVTELIPGGNVVHRYTWLNDSTGIAKNIIDNLGDQFVDNLSDLITTTGSAVGAVTDGLGLEGSVTTQALFIKKQL